PTLLRSSIPSSARVGGPRDDFEFEALRRPRQLPDQPYNRFEKYRDRAVLCYYDTASRIGASCVGWQNGNPQGSRTGRITVRLVPSCPAPVAGAGPVGLHVIYGNASSDHWRPILAPGRVASDGPYGSRMAATHDDIAIRKQQGG